MKTVEDIEKLSLEELENIAGDTYVKVPEDLRTSIEALAGASALTEEKPAARRPVWPRFAVAAAIAAVMVLGISLGGHSEPEDTFDDPYLAYAEIQRTFDRIGHESEKVKEIAGNSVPVMEKTDELINKYIK